MAIAEQCFRKPFATVGFMAPVVLALMLLCQVKVVLDTEQIDAVATWVPELEHWLAFER